MNKAKISIIIPVYNGEEYLKTAIDSVLNQTMKEIELICVNDGSTDNSLKILEEYAKNDERIKIITQKNQGQGVARNNGLNIFNGEYIMFLDCDDYFELNACEKCYNTITEQNVDFVIFTSKTFSYDAPINMGMENTVRLNKYKDFFNQIIYTSQFDHNEYFLPIAPWCKIYDKKYFKELNIRFPEKFIFEDVPFMLDIMFNSDKFYILEDCLYNYYYPRKNQTTSNQTLKVFDIFKAFSYIEKNNKEKINNNFKYILVKFSNLNYWFSMSKWYVKILYFLKFRQEIVKLYLDGWTDKDIEEILPLDRVHAFLNFNFIKIFKQLKR